MGTLAWLALGVLAGCAPGPECTGWEANGRVAVEVGRGTDGATREAEILGTSEAGAPLVVFWHGRGQRPRDVIAAAGLAEVAAAGAVVVVPGSTDPDGQTWTVAAGGRDEAFFDAIVSCATEARHVEGVFVSGFSFGGFLATALAMHAEALAGAVVFSGGLDGTSLSYEEPSEAMPVLLSWGGPSDTVLGANGETIRFPQLTRSFGDALAADDHDVWACDHGGGHRIPGAAPRMIQAWIYQDPTALPAGCEPWPEESP